MVFAVLLWVYPKDQSVKSMWTEAPVKINGADNEWVESPLNLEKKMSIDYAFKNDADYLYVLLKFKDPKYLSSINITGVTIYHHAEGKKKKDFGVKFLQKMVTAEEYIAYLEKSKVAVTEEQKTEMRKNQAYPLPYVEVIDKKNKNKEAAQDAKPAVYQVITQDNTITFEFAIPLEKPAGLSPGIGTEPGKSIKVGFDWGGVTEQMRQQWMKTGSLKGGGGGGGISDGKSSGVNRADYSGGRGAGLTALRKRFKQYNFWVDLQLAQN